MKHLMPRILFSASLLLLGFARCFSQPGVDGAGNITTSGAVINAYTPLLTTATAGTTGISADIASLNNGTALTTGSLVMVIGMQGATIDVTNTANYGQIINYNSAGLYEFAYVCSVSGTSTITLQSPLVNTYTVGGANRVQVVRVPQYTTLTINAGASVTGTAWNGASGGIVAASVTGAATVNGSIVADAIGFRGGVISNFVNLSHDVTDFVNTTAQYGGEKGEGIAGFETDYDAMGGRFCRGAAANGGGGANSWNTGGGGGANGNNGVAWNGLGNPSSAGGANWITAWNLEAANFANNVSSGGGRAGYSWAGNSNNATTTAPGNGAWGGDDRQNIGGWGGRPLTINAENTIFLGGGGGAGNEDNNLATDGAPGGGIVYLVATTVTGTGTITANGGGAATSVSDVGGPDDAPGGGGGGGTIIIKSAVAATLTLNANGGLGGNQVAYTNESEGPGGGGGGGYVAINSGTPTITVTGAAGGTTNSPGVSAFPPDGATAGATGQVATVSTAFINYDTVAITSSATSICAGGSAVLTASGAATYVWSNGGTTASITVSPASSITYTVTATFAGGCTATDTGSVTVYPLPVAAVTPPTITICAGTGTTLTASGGAGYLWSNASTTTSITVTPAATTNYTVTAATAFGCTATASGTVTVDTPLVSITPAGDTICPTANATLTANGAAGYLWSNGSTTSAITVSPPATTTYTITATDIAACTVTDSATVTVDTFAVTINPPISNICLGNSVTLACNANTASASTYIWSTGGTNQNITPSPATITTYMVTATDANHCTSIASALVNVDAPVVSIRPTAPAICAGQDTTLTATGTGNATYAWSNGVTTAANTVSPATTTQYKVVATDTLNCTATDSVTVTVYPIPVPEFNDHAPQCLAGNSFNFMAQGSFLPSATFAWNFGPGATPPTSGSQNQTVTYSTGQTVGVSLIISQFGCVSNPYVDSVIIYPMPVAVFNPDTIIGCPDQVVCFTNNSIVTGVPSYFWNFGDGETSSATAPCHTYQNPGTYSVGLTVTANNCVGDTTYPNLITIIPNPVAAFTPDPAVVQLPQAQINFTNQSSNATSYVWNFDAEGTSTDVNPMFTFAQYGIHNVLLTAYNQLMCADSIQLPVTVLPPQSFFIPNVFTPNNDGNNDNFYIEMQEGVTVVEFTVFDRWGEKVHDGTYPWDGTFKGKPCQQDVYVYVFKLLLAGNTDGIMRRGSVTLLR